MVGSTSHEFTEMVGMGMRIEEGIHEGRLTKGSASASGSKSFGNNYPKKKE